MFQREKFNAEIALQREKMQVEAQEREKERNLMLQKEKIATDIRREAEFQKQKDKEMERQRQLMQQLAEEKQRVATLEKQKEIDILQLENDRYLLEQAYNAKIKQSSVSPSAGTALSAIPETELSQPTVANDSVEVEHNSSSAHSSPPQRVK